MFIISRIYVDIKYLRMYDTRVIISKSVNRAYRQSAKIRVVPNNTAVIRVYEGTFVISKRLTIYEGILTNACISIYIITFDSFVRMKVF